MEQSPAEPSVAEGVKRVSECPLPHSTPYFRRLLNRGASFELRINAELRLGFIVLVALVRCNMGQERSNQRIGGKKSLTHSPACLIRSAPQRSVPLCSILLRSVPLHSTPLCSAPLRTALLPGSFVSEKMAMY